MWAGRARDFSTLRVQTARESVLLSNRKIRHQQTTNRSICGLDTYWRICYSVKIQITLPMNNCSDPDIPLLAPPAAALLVQKNCDCQEWMSHLTQLSRKMTLLTVSASVLIKIKPNNAISVSYIKTTIIRFIQLMRHYFRIKMALPKSWRKYVTRGRAHFFHVHGWRKGKTNFVDVQSCLLCWWYI